jgi:hypothetical protein
MAWRTLRIRCVGPVNKRAGFATRCADDPAPRAEDRGMTTTAELTERCATCGGEADNAHAYCHFHAGGATRVFCSPACAEAALHGGESARPEVARAGGDYIADMVARMRWERWS